MFEQILSFLIVQTSQKFRLLIITENNDLSKMQLFIFEKFLEEENYPEVYPKSCGLTFKELYHNFPHLRNRRNFLKKQLEATEETGKFLDY